MMLLSPLSTFWASGWVVVLWCSQGWSNPNLLPGKWQLLSGLWWYAGLGSPQFPLGGIVSLACRDGCPPMSVCLGI